jgi:Ca2+-binding RTX toxin-like protein
VANDHTNISQGSPASAEALNAAPIMLNAAGAETVTVPHGSMLLNANFARSGSDLQLTRQSDEQVIVQNFFGTEMAPVLATEGGAKIMPDVAESLAGPDILGGGEGDATLLGQSDQLIGAVNTVEGGVFATRADGTRTELNEGDPVYQGDVLETDDEGAISLTFVDSTEFALDQGTRLVLVEMVFDAQTGEGSSSFTVVQGIFTFVSGQVAKSGSGAMTVNTPVATIGIRGTKATIKAGSEDEDTVITLLQEDGGHIGEISVTNDAGTQVMNQANQTTFIQSSTIAPTQPSILPSELLRSIFTEDSSDSRGVWRFEEGVGERNDEATFEETINNAKKVAAKEGSDEETVENAEAAAELAFELALAEGEDEEGAQEQAEEAFQNTLTDENAANSLIQTAAGSDEGGTDSVFDYDPTAGFGGADPGPGTFGGAAFGGPNDVLPDGASTAFVDPVIRGGKGADTLTGIDGADEIIAGGGDDTVSGEPGVDTIDGGTGGDILDDDADDDTIAGGDDVISGGDGVDIAFGGAGDDEINMGARDDLVIGGAADDLVGGAGVDTLRISMTRDEFEGSDFQAEVGAYRADSGTPFHFYSINMDVESFEHLQVEVGGTIIVAEPPTMEVGNVFGAEDSAILLCVGASLNDADGAESLKIEIGGLPEGSTLHYIGGNSVAQSIGITDGEGTVVISGETQSVLDTMAITPPEGDLKDFVIKVTATAVEIDGSVSSVSDNFSVIVNGIPTALPDTVSGDEKLACSLAI